MKNHRPLRIHRDPVLRPWATLATVIFLAVAAPVAAQNPPPTATNLWQLEVGAGGAHSSPALAPDGTIYQATFEGTLLAITPEGSIHWTFNTGTETEIQSSPAVADDGTIYFGSRNRKFYAVTPDGRLKWSFTTDAWVDSSPAIAADGTIYFGSWDKNFYALNPQGGLKWKFPAGAIIVSSPAIGADGTVYFGAMDKNFYALDPTGKVKWTFATGGEIISSPAIGPDGGLYLTSTDGNLYSLKNDGTERWHAHTGGYTAASPVLDQTGNIYVAAYGEAVLTPDGKHLPGSGTACPVSEAAVAVTGRVYWSRPWRTLEAFPADDKVTGEVLWQADTEDNLSSSPVVGKNGVVYATCDRRLYAIQPVGDGLPLARSSWPMFHANPRHTGRVQN